MLFLVRLPSPTCRCIHEKVGAIFVGMCGGGKAAPRVGFVAEVTTGLMPIVGWSRVLFGDILLQRAFHKVWVTFGEKAVV